MKNDLVCKGFKQSKFINLIGFEIENIEESEIKLKLSVREELSNNNGSLHGGVHATMLDTILGMTIRYQTKLPCTTINLNINYLNTATSDEIYATGKILRQGYKNVTAEGEIYDTNGILLAKATGTFKLLRK